MSAQEGVAAAPHAAFDPANGARAQVLADVHASLVPGRRRGWLVRRSLAAADVVGLATAFVIATAIFPATPGVNGRFGVSAEILVFLATLPLWLLAAKLYGLYDHDEERTDHATVDEFTGVLNLVTMGTWIVFAGAWLTDLVELNPLRAVAFWLLAVLLVTAGRSIGRTLCRRSASYVQNTLIVGAGDVGQLVARKLLHHPEYGVNVVGFVDNDPKQRWPGLEGLALLGEPADVPHLVRMLDVERVVIAFSGESHEATIALVRSLRDLDVQVDVVPRLFEIVGPKVGIHTVEGLPVVGLPPSRLSRSSRWIKRSIDIAGAVAALVATAPLFAFIAWRIKRDSEGPIFFRQTRVGVDMRQFTALKFRTMKVDADTRAHRDYVKATMTATATPALNGIFKLELADAVTPIGRWLRKTSLDELPQLINVLRGEMSLVGPRPCIPYETENFQPHHFERFLVPPGMTGLWQVTARARSTFGEALEMDVAYARGWSLGLDLKLLCRTPLALVRARGTA